MEQLSPSSFCEKHTLHGRSDTIRFSVGREVLLRAENDDIPKERDSERVVVQTLSQYKGAQRVYGRIVDAKNGLVAYRIFNQKTGEAVRLLGINTSPLRLVIKDFKFQIADLQWSNVGSTLAVTDVQANLYIYDFDDSQGTGRTVRQISLIRCHKTSDAKPKCAPRITWCPYVRHEGNDASKDKLLVAICVGSTVDVFDVNTLCGGDQGEFTFEVEDDLEKRVPGHYRLTASTPIVSVRISPDGTAVAIATEETINFYVPGNDSEGFRLAQEWTPSASLAIYDFCFLDDVTSPRKAIDGDTFWKQCLVLFEKGRYLTVVDETWNLASRLKINEKSQTDSPLHLTVDPSARFVFLTDYEDGMVYSLELGMVGNAMRFLSVTQVTFCSNIVYNYMVPHAISITAKPTRRIQSGSHLSTSGSDTAVEVAIIDFIGLSPSAVSKLQVELDVTSTDLLSFEDEEEQEIKALEKSLELQNLSDDDGEKAGSSGFYARAKSAPDNKETCKESTDESYPPSSSEQTSSSLDAPQNGYSAKEIAELSVQVGDLNESIKDLSARIVGLEDAQGQFQEAMRTEMCSALETISDEIANRQEKTLDSVGKMMEEQRSVVESLLTTAAADTSTMEAQMKEMCKNIVQESFSKVVIPTMEKLCENMFQQLNDRFTEGLQEYVEQIRASVQNSVQLAATPTPTLRENLISLIQEGQIDNSFELALKADDLAMLMFVCNKVDPDEYLGKENSPLPVESLLSLLTQLSSKLNTDVELKLKYVEYATMFIQRHQNEVAMDPATREILEKVRNTFSEFIHNANTKDIHRRQVRLLHQLISNLLK